MKSNHVGSNYIFCNVLLENVTCFNKFLELFGCIISHIFVWVDLFCFAIERMFDCFWCYSIIAFETFFEREGVINNVKMKKKQKPNIANALNISFLSIFLKAWLFSTNEKRIIFIFILIFSCKQWMMHVM